MVRGPPGEQTGQTRVGAVGAGQLAAGRTHSAGRQADPAPLGASIRKKETTLCSECFPCAIAAAEVNVPVSATTNSESASSVLA